VGPVTETKEQHLKRHSGGLRSCPRCRYYQRGQQWARAHGHVAETSRAGPRGAVWLAERPVRWGGTWGLGCAICADSVARVCVGQVVGGKDVASKRRLGTAWARYEVRARCLQAEHIRQHQDYDVHRVGVLAWLRPDEPVYLAMQRTLSDDSLLAGSVPQPADWLRAWSATRTPQSWQAAAKNLATEHFIRPARERSVQARPLESMARVMQEAIRQDKREFLRKSTAISLSFDDRAGYKLVRYRATVAGGTLAASQGASLPISEGLLGCIQCLRGSTLEDLADDYAVRASKEILALLSRFCTPLGDSRDDALYDRVLLGVRSICADGALQKVAHVLRQSAMPNVILIQRDPAHFIRIACKEPLVRTGRFEEQHQRLFGKKGILRSIQFSDGLQARLEDCQKKVLRHQGVQGGSVKHIMRHFSFAAHRFESWTAPRRKYVCCLLAVALLLAEVAGDSRRNASERRQAEEALAAMTPQNLLEVGLAADFGEICMRLGVSIATLKPSRCHA